MWPNILHKTFGNLYILCKLEARKHTRILYKCECSCGNIVSLSRDQILRSKTQSCGCVWKPQRAKLRITHSMSGTTTYNAWVSMRARCCLPQNKRYFDYGGRGIKVCDRWLESFENFLEDMGERPFPKAQIDRIDNNGDYSPENCRWVTATVNSNNKRDRKDSHFITHEGITKTITQWSKSCGISVSTIRDRLGRGWTFERAITSIKKENNSMATKEDRFSRMRQKTKQRAVESEREGFFSYLKFPEGEKVNFFSPKKGTHEVDILPYEITKTIGNPDGLEKGDVFHRRLIYVHEKVGSANKKYLCPSTIGKPCPICEARSALYAEGTAESKILAGGLRKKVRELRNVIVLTTPEDKKKGIQIWNSSHPLFGDLLEKEIRDSQRKDRSGFAMLEGGNTLTLRFDEKTIGEKGKPFPFCDRIDFDAREDYDEDILEDVFDLDACLDVLSYDELEKIFLEVEAEEKEEEVEEAPKKRKSKEVEEDEEPPKRSRKVKEEVEEEEPPRRKKKVVEEEPEDEEPPKRSRRSKVEEPEEEEEPPKRSRRTKVEEEPEEEVEEPKRKKKVVEEEEEPPKRSKRTVVEDDDEPSCPVKGGVFGKDVNKYDEGKHNCFDCEQWKACKKENDRLKGK